MLLIACPFCGPRNESEFVHGGPVKPRRPDQPDKMGDQEWVEYLTVPPNPIGPVDEYWWHVRGCGKWVKISRDTRTHEIIAAPGDDS
ncbi:MAG: sarcosine oxidase subunit delta [Gammaproteobacteria bacterium]|jgi:sarcosine oxidase subunit delta